MTDPRPPQDAAATTYRTMEIVVAAIFFALGAVVIADSLRLGAGWADDGPQAGYFPFYIGLVMCVASAVIGFKTWRKPPKGDDVFVTRPQLKQIMALLVPSIVYVVAIGFIGVYVASAIFLACFMARHGAHRWWTTAATAIGLPFVLFLMFEIWFKTPLPKGPLEAWLGYA
jgi:putative tricarboxylic transport membrane protein